MSETDATNLGGADARALTGLNPANAVPSDKRGMESDVAAGKESEIAEQTGPPAPGTRRPRRKPVAPDVAEQHEAAPSDTEIELKLVVDPEQLAGFNEASIIAANARSKGSRKHLKTIYYDTPEQKLRRQGLTLRVRQSGTRFTQTVKTESDDDPLTRGEWEASVPSTAPDVALAAPFIPAKLRDDLERHALEPVFTSDIHRHQRLIDLPSGTVEVAFDHGLLNAGERALPVNEIELELKAGSASAIYELALRLAEHGPVRPSIQAKSERGFDLAEDAPPTAPKPRKLRLDPSVPLDDVFAQILRACLHHLLQSLPAAEDGRDVEGVHQLRVALRRLRSALHLMRSVGSLSKLELLRSEAKWLASNLSAAREWDIFQSQTLPAIAKGCPSVAGFDTLDEVAEKRRSAAYRQVRGVLSDRRCATFVLSLGAWIEARGWRSDIAPENLSELAEPAIAFAQRTLSAQYAKVLKRGRHLKSMGPEQRHRLRLAVKKLRYGTDFLLPLCGQGKSVKRFRDRLIELQEELGSYNDMATTASLLSGLGVEAPNGGTAAAAIAGWQAHGMVSAEGRLRDAWRNFAKAKVPWAQDAKA
ncbi:CYTH and CHAD domain-containing protein [Bradyrhizobium sp. Tv2a-2]|uniref:CYTH and CHAD domain-containing protein n=1 Tax=Bradyrhizobium sp. Tv2a-2 TaxID=113395 RepID=UPI0004674404|nr:CYTH and CHAD domain-containing protein [Bradyrhizobium sp. Tv2a-2]